MSFEKILTVLFITMFAFFGVTFLLFPLWWGEKMGLAFLTPVAITDVRATYGGFEIGLVCFLSYCLKKPGWLPVALLAQGLCILGFAFGRGVGLLMDGVHDVWMPLFIVIEITMGGTSLFLFRKHSSS